MKIVSDPRIPSAVVLESNTAEIGEYQIRVLSHAQLLTGDKISTTHGQKGVIRIVQSHDLPMIVMKDGSTMIADLYMAVGSVTSRQTVGQIFESSQAHACAASGETNYVAQEGDIELVECDYLMSGETGEIMEGFLEDKSKTELRASVGFVRVFNQTQLTRERHHLTHSSEGKHSLGTSSGRAAGGGVATSEMDFHAMFSSACVNKSANTYELEHV
ncbi:hypothetical protein Golomagni_04795 [Golovinomyces magnicellulatus]|nr:hypothetical protein Golomagni_04795 [Golovinomyces magnicellulatus]